MVAELVVVEIVLTAIAGALVYLGVRRERRSFGTSEEQATMRTLAFATSSLQELRQGLTQRGAGHVLPEIASRAGAPAVALYVHDRLLSYYAQPAGPGENHRLHLDASTAAVDMALSAGRLKLVPAHSITVEGCGLSTMIVAPIAVEGSVVAALATFHTVVPSPAALRIASDLAELLATQLRLQHADDQRVALAKAELRALRAQISPHFLYNTLTTIAAFVRSDPERARELLVEFADFTRKCFNSSQGEFSSLADELVFVHKYLNLEQARLGERLRVNYKVDPEVLNVAVPVLAVQPLVENAVKHGIEPRRIPGTITIAAVDEDDECQLLVRDDGCGFDSSQWRIPGAGALDNIDRRLRQVYGANYGIQVESAPGSGTTVRLRVPKYRPGVRAS